MFKRALVSTSDKTGLVEFLTPLLKRGCEVVSTGGTSKYLRDHGIKVTEVGEATGFPEVMDGRVRTLHPYIHMGLLARSFVPEDLELLKKHRVKPFDLVVVNLYPFEKAFRDGLKEQDLIEQIDIGGPSLLRAAAKSFERVTVLCDPCDYAIAAEPPAIETRKMLAAKVFEHCSYYDSVVSHALRDSDWEKAKKLTIGLKKRGSLRYGENPHQRAAWYESGFPHPLSLHLADQIQGKELSYNNILDLEAAVGAVADFDRPACVIVKHLTPCGVAAGSNALDAYKRAFDADSVSAFGGIVAVNKKIEASLAQELVKPFLECVVAPDVDSGALGILSSKKNLRVLKLKNLMNPHKDAELDFEFRSIRGGALVQSTDRPTPWSSDWKITGPEPDELVRADMLFAQTVVRHVKSNAIVVAKNQQTLGVCGGQTNRVDSVKMALARVNDRAKDLVLASDAFFPFRDSIDLAARAGVKWVIQPGGSLRDKEVEEAAHEHGIGMVITGTRHFKH